MEKVCFYFYKCRKLIENNFFFFVNLDRSQQWDGGERDRATAMYVACKYLPAPLLSSPGERAGMLAEAAKTLEKIGDRKKLNDCYQLMKSLGSSSVTN